VEKAFAKVGITIEWKGKGLEEKGIDGDTGKVLIRIDPRYFRPTEVDFLLGDPSKAKKTLGWEPVISFDELVDLMVKEDIREAEKDSFCREKGFRTFSHFD